jgi:hypothetical protein
MKLAKTAGSESSLYESFSDLIFGTLVLFLVVLMGLALQVQESQQKQAKAEAAAQLVYQGRFDGGSDRTLIYYGHVPIDGKIHVVWIPEALSTRWDLDWENGAGETGPEGVCRYFLEFGDEIYLSLAKLEGIRSAVNADFVRSMTEEPRVALALHLARTVSSSQPGKNWTPAELAAAIGGNGLSVHRWNIPPRIERIVEEYGGWMKATTGDQYYGRGVTIPLLKKGVPESVDPARLEFSADGDEVVLGKTRVSALGMAALLRSIKPGKGFFIEYVDPTGAREVAPPDWVRAKILVPTGYTERLLSDKGLQKIAERD